MENPIDTRPIEFLRNIIEIASVKPHTKYISKYIRDTVAKALKAKKIRFTKRSVRNQQLHPEYIEDFQGDYKVGYGNTDYLRIWSVLYCIDHDTIL